MLHLVLEVLGAVAWFFVWRHASYYLLSVFILEVVTIIVMKRTDYYRALGTFTLIQRFFYAYLVIMMARMIDPSEVLGLVAISATIVPALMRWFRSGSIEEIFGENGFVVKTDRELGWIFLVLALLPAFFVKEFLLAPSWVLSILMAVFLLPKSLIEKRKVVDGEPDRNQVSSKTWIMGYDVCWLLIGVFYCTSLWHG